MKENERDYARNNKNSAELTFDCFDELYELQHLAINALTGRTISSSL